MGFWILPRLANYQGEDMSIIDIQRRYAKSGTVTKADVDNFTDLMHNGGFTRHVTTGETPKDGYMVSLHRDHGGDEFVRDQHEVEPQDLAEHRTRAQAENPDTYQGGWTHQGDVYLDRSVNVKDEAQARTLGKAHKQLAIWDVANGRDVPLGK